MYRFLLFLLLIFIVPHTVWSQHSTFEGVIEKKSVEKTPLPWNHLLLPLPSQQITALVHDTRRNQLCIASHDQGIFFYSLENNQVITSLLPGPNSWQGEIHCLYFYEAEDQLFAGTDSGIVTIIFTPEPQFLHQTDATSRIHNERVRAMGQLSEIPEMIAGRDSGIIRISESQSISELQPSGSGTTKTTGTVHHILAANNTLFFSTDTGVWSTRNGFTLTKHPFSLPDHPSTSVLTRTLLPMDEECFLAGTIHGLVRIYKNGQRQADPLEEISLRFINHLTFSYEEAKKQRERDDLTGLWVGTASDGIRVKTEEKWLKLHTSLKTISDDSITGILALKEGIFVATAYGGINHYSSRWFLKPSRIQTLENGEYAALETLNDNLYAASGDGLICFTQTELKKKTEIPIGYIIDVFEDSEQKNEQAETTDTQNETAETKISPLLTDLAADKEGILWIASDGSGIRGLQKEEIIKPDQPVPHLSNQITALFMDTDTTLWFLMKNTDPPQKKPLIKKCGRIRIENNRFVSRPLSYPTGAERADTDFTATQNSPTVIAGLAGEMIVGQSKEVLFQRHDYHWQYVVPQIRIPQTLVAITDEKGRFWLGTEEGIAIKENEQWTHYNRFPTATLNAVEAIHINPAAPGIVFIGTNVRQENPQHAAFLFLYNEAAGWMETRPFPEKITALHLLEDYLYVATVKGLFRLRVTQKL